MAEPNIPHAQTESIVLIELMKQVHHDVNKLRDELRKHISEETDEIAEAITINMNKAFPGGDPDGHRLAHEETMRIIHDRAEFWQKLLFEISKYGLIGVVSWLSFVIWTGFLKGPTK